MLNLLYNLKEKHLFLQLLVQAKRLHLQFFHLFQNEMFIIYHLLSFKYFDDLFDMHLAMLVFKSFEY